jgi:hypothetical protein
LEALEEEVVQLTELRGVLVGGLLDEIDELILRNIGSITTQIVLC